MVAGQSFLLEDWPVFVLACRQAEVDWLQHLNNRKVPPPSVFRMLWIDYLAFRAFMDPVLIWMVLAAVLVFHAFPAFTLSIEAGRIFVGLAVLITLVRLTMLVLRIVYIRNLFLKGVLLRGELKKVFFYWEWGQIGYRFRFHGQTFNGYYSVHRNGRLKNIASEDIILLVNPHKPKQVLVYDLYAEKDSIPDQIEIL